MFFSYSLRGLRPLLGRSHRARSWVAAALVSLTATALSQSQPTALDLDGRAVNPVQDPSGKVVVLIFVRRDCPISGRYAPTIQRLSLEHPRDVHFYLVFPDKSDSAA